MSFQKGNQLYKLRKTHGFTKGSKHTKEARKKIKKNNARYWLGKRRLSMAGEANPNWSGGETSCSFKYRQWRSDVFTGDDFTCQKCGLRGCYLEAHHINRFVDILEQYNIKNFEEALACEELWNINNGRTLCHKCHNKTKK